jgi:hypothetical protein
VKKRVWLAKGYGSFQSAWLTLQGIETLHTIRKGRVRWLAKDDALGQALSITDLFGIAACRLHLAIGSAQPQCCLVRTSQWNRRSRHLRDGIGAEL